MYNKYIKFLAKTEKTRWRYLFVLFLLILWSGVIIPLYAAGEIDIPPDISDDERKSAFTDVRTLTSNISADKNDINTKSVA